MASMCTFIRERRRGVIKKSSNIIYESKLIKGATYQTISGVSACLCVKGNEALASSDGGGGSESFSPGRIQRRRRGRGWRWQSRNIQTSVSSLTAALRRPPSWRGRSWSQSHTRGCLWWVCGPGGCLVGWEGNSAGEKEKVMCKY